MDDKTMRGTILVNWRKCMFLYMFLAAVMGWMNTATAAHSPEKVFGYAEKSTVDYYIDGIIPTYKRSLPISNDDPNLDIIAEDALIRYQYGYAFQDVNDYYFYNRLSEKWEGKAPLMDTGILIGGNTRSKHDAKQLDSDSIDFASILPYANLYIDPKKLSYKEGNIEYNFYTDVFNYNNSLGEVPENIRLVGNETLTTYMEMFPDLAYPRKRSVGYPEDWEGIIYTGGIQKTVSDGEGGFTETVVENDDGSGNSRLFSVRYRDAAIDQDGYRYDLVLTFTRITFVAEADVTGALGILEANNLYVAPVLYKDGEYTIVINDETNRIDVHDQNGVRIGARFEFDYRVEDSEGNLVDGLILYSMNDLDNASMAPMLQTDANWGTNPLGNDFRWAEGFGIVRGAASFAAMPYYNHSMRDVYDRIINNRNGDTSLLRVSRMEGILPDGTANGLYFTTSITSVSGTGARNDADTLDTGVAMLIEPAGSMRAAISAGRRGDVNITFFDSSAANKIEQSCSEGGRIFSLDCSMKAEGQVVENEDFIKVVGGGSSSMHRIEPDEKHRIYNIRIDGRIISFRELKWTEGSDGNNYATYTLPDEYGRYIGRTEYQFIRDAEDNINVEFKNIQDDHEIYIEFVRKGLFGMFRILGSRSLITIFMLAGFCALVFIASVLWMFGGKRKNVMPK